MKKIYLKAAIAVILLFVGMISVYFIGEAYLEDVITTVKFIVLLFIGVIVILIGVIFAMIAQCDYNEEDRIEFIMHLYKCNRKDAIDIINTIDNEDSYIN